MNRKRPCYYRLLRSRHLRHATSVTSAKLAQYPLALFGLIYLFVAVAALTCTAWAPAMVFGTACCGCLTRPWKPSLAPRGHTQHPPTVAVELTFAPLLHR